MLTLGLIAYVAAAIVCYCGLYSNSLNHHYRFKTPYDPKKNELRNFHEHFSEALSLMALDFFKIHCPWSKKVSIDYRVREAHSLLRDRKHSKGWTAAHCDMPEHHTQIAYDCFSLRTVFWLRQIVAFAASPISTIVLAVVFVKAHMVLRHIEHPDNQGNRPAPKRSPPAPPTKRRSF